MAKQDPKVSSSSTSLLFKLIEDDDREREEITVTIEIQINEIRNMIDEMADRNRDSDTDIDQLKLNVNVLQHVVEALQEHLNKDNPWKVTTQFHCMIYAFFVCVRIEYVI